MLLAIQQSLNDFRKSYPSYLSFELFYMLLTSFLYVPLVSFIFNQMLKWIGSSTLLNAEVYQIALTLPGLLGLVLITFLAVIFLFIEFGVLILIAHKRYFNSSIQVTEALYTSIRKLPGILGFSSLYFVGILIFIIPFIDSSNMPALLDINLPILLTNWVYGSYLFGFIYLGLFLIGAFLLVRLIFTLHYILLEKKNVWNAIKLSFKLTRSNQQPILFSIILLNAIIFIIGFVIMTSFSFIIEILEIGIIGHGLKNYFTTISSYVAISFSILLIPLNLLMITRLFYHLKMQKGEEITDHVQIHSLGFLNKIEKGIKKIFPKKKYTFVGVVVLAMTGMFFLNHSVTSSFVYLKWDVSVASHRGDYRNGPENSISSIEAALQQGFNAIEMDVQLTQDGVVVLNHDKTLKRMAGISSSINELTYEEVKQIDIGERYSEKYQGERIPTLDEVLELLESEGVKLIIDVKEITTSNRSKFANQLVDIIERHGLEEDAYIQAFDYSTLKEIREQNEAIKIGQILYLAAGNLSNLDVDFYTIRQTMLSDRFVEKAHKLNREVWVWTVNLDQNIKEVLKYDIDGIITDYPERVQNVIGVDLAEPVQEE